MKYGIIVVLDATPEAEKQFNTEAERKAFREGVLLMFSEMGEFLKEDRVPVPELALIPMEILHNSDVYANYFFKRSSHPRHYDGPPVAYETLKAYYSETEWSEFISDTKIPEVNWDHPVYKSSTKP